MRTWWRYWRETLDCMMRLRPHLRAGRNLVVAVVVSAFVAAALEGVGVGMLVPLINLLLGGEGHRPMRPIAWLMEVAPGHGPAFYIVAFCGVVAGAIASKNVVLYVSTVLAARLRCRLATNMREAMYRRLLGADMAVFEQRAAGEVANGFGSETFRALATFDLLLSAVQRGCMLLCYVVAMVVISWRLTLVTVVLGGAIGGVVAFLSKRLHQQGRDLTEANQRLSSQLVESFAGIRVIKATHSWERELARFQEANRFQARTEERSTRISGLFMPLAEVVAVAGAMLIVGGAYVFFVRTGLMLSSHLFGFGFILLRMLPLLNQLYSMQGHLLYMSAGVREVEKWLATPQHPHRPFGDRGFVGVREAIRFEGVSFTYPNGTQALSDVGFDWPAGRTVALVGASGSGKSTVAGLLLRFRHPTSGRITVDGVDYWEFSPASWHQGVAIVEQEAFLFHDTMERNIGYGFPEVRAEEVQRAIELAHLEDVVRELPAGLQTVVGERGTTLSGGQRQRLAIARALVRNPKILILDEATSALDTVSERQVQSALSEAMRGRTVLVIAHRLSTVRSADHIVVMDHGRVVEQGTWGALEGRGGVFTRLVRSASGVAGLIG